jgi:hypothetical protein
MSYLKRLKRYVKGRETEEEIEIERKNEGERDEEKGIVRGRERKREMG